MSSESEQRAAVLHVLEQFGPMTAGELRAVMFKLTVAQYRLPNHQPLPALSGLSVDRAVIALEADGRVRRRLKLEAVDA